MVLYMAVTNDRYELPVAVTKSAREMADFLGIEQCTVYSYISRKTIRRKDNVKLVRVRVDDTED